MDFDQYVAARYGRLIEHAVLLGCAEGEAGNAVDQVLLEQRRRIRRADDPDPLVRAALERKIEGEPEKRGRTPRLLAGVLVVAGIATATVLTHGSKPLPVPSLFALDGGQAEQLLEKQGFDVQVEKEPTCDPGDLVVGSIPGTGQPVAPGGTITVRTALVSGSRCEDTFPWRVFAWQFMRYVLDLGPAPPFGTDPHIYVDGRPSIDRWTDLTMAVNHAAEGTATTASGLPHLLVQRVLPDRRFCGARRPPHTNGVSAIRLQVTHSDEDIGGCPLTIDLYRDLEGRIDTVAVYDARA